jgi:hypothetical protein
LGAIAETTVYQGLVRLFTLTGVPLPNKGCGDSSPFKRPVPRAHFSSSIIQGSYDNNGGPIFEPEYPNQAMKGSIDQGFKSVRIPPRFAARVERQDPQPGVCKDKSA